MAHGFKREKGTGRGYINVDNPLFAPGMRLSRRQYDKFVGALGARTREPVRSPRMIAQRKGLNRYYYALDVYVTKARREGRTINKRQAAKETAFREAAEKIKPKKRRGETEAQRRDRVAAGYRVFTDDVSEFWEQYRNQTEDGLELAA